MDKDQVFAITRAFLTYFGQFRTIGRVEPPGSTPRYDTGDGT